MAEESVNNFKTSSIRVNSNQVQDQSCSSSVDNSSDTLKTRFGIPYSDQNVNTVLSKNENLDMEHLETVNCHFGMLNSSKIE